MTENYFGDIQVRAHTRNGHEVSAHTRKRSGNGINLEISKEINALSDTRDKEVNVVKDVLNNLGYGGEENSFTTGIKQFQKDNNLKIDGYMKPKGETITKLNEAKDDLDLYGRKITPMPDTSKMTTRELLEGTMNGTIPITKTDPDTGFSYNEFTKTDKPQATSEMGYIKLPEDCKNPTHDLMMHSNKVSVVNNDKLNPLHRL